MTIISAVLVQGFVSIRLSIQSNHLQDLESRHRAIAEGLASRISIAMLFSPDRELLFARAKQLEDPAEKLFFWASETKHLSDPRSHALTNVVLIDQDGDGVGEIADETDGSVYYLTDETVRVFCKATERIVEVPLETKTNLHDA